MRNSLAALAALALLGASPALAQNQGDSSQATAPGAGGSPFATNGMPSNNPGSNPGGQAAAPGAAVPQPVTADRRPAAPTAPAR